MAAARTGWTIRLIMLAGVALLAAGAVFLWRTLPAPVVDARAAEDWDYVPPADLPFLLPERRLPGIRVAVLTERENIQVTAPGFHAGEVGRWREWLEAAGARLVPASEAEVLVFPYAACLGVENRARIARHLERGGGLVTTGPLGAYDGECRPLRDTMLVHLLGGDGESPVVAEPSRRAPYAVVLGETLLGAGLPPGTRLDLSPLHRLVFRQPGRGVYFSDFGRQPIRQGGEAFFDAAAARALVGPGRVVAFGFGLSEAQGEWSEQVARRMMANAVTWAAGRPVAQLATWPRGDRAAAVVAQDVEADFANAAGAVEVIERHDIPTTYFLVGELARSNRFVTRKMVRSGEIASHSYHHLPMDGFSDAGQREELALAKREIEALSEREVRGFRPPQERFTLETLRAWTALGGDYVFAYSGMRTAGPELLSFGSDTLVFLGRVVADDFEILSRSRIRDRGRMVSSMMRQIDEVVALRGAYLFSYHSHMFAQRKLLPVLEELVAALAARPEVWKATAGEVARWWRARAAIEVETAPDGASVALHNRGGDTFEGGVLLVDVPNGEQLRMALPALDPGERVSLPLPPPTGPR